MAPCLWRPASVDYLRILREMRSIMGIMKSQETQPFGLENLENGTIGSIAGMKLEELRDRFREELYNEYLPFLEEHVIDDRYGGFLCHATPDGEHINTEKRAWYEGRGIWIYAYLHNKMGGNPRHLEIAAKSAEFTMRLQPSGDMFFPASFTRDGKIGRAHV